jgi:tape measure domain-containing protein
MASKAADLKVRVGFLFDEKALAGIERSMRSSGQRLSRLGSDMTLAISAPLAALGVTAVKAAGDLESLTLALKSQLGSAEAAGKELDLLNEAAKNPGLGLEQAVRGSVRLQGVGLAADEARETLIQMGNAIAATGGTAVELDNVTKQFAQMISKGRVLQEDVSILSENMPGLAQLMQQAFGTQSVEAIREMGVGGKEFVKRITEAAKELPRVEGGIKNNIGNAIDSLKISAGKLGLALNNAFDISGNIDRLASFIAAAADSFSQLDAGTQKLIIGLAGVAVAAGPVLKVFGTLKLTGAEIVNVWRTALLPAAKSLVAGIGQITTAIRAMNVATQTFILIGLVTAVVLIAKELGAYNRELTAAEKAQRSLNDIQQEAANSIGDQKSKIDVLVATYKDEKTTLEEKEKILKQLNIIAPQYYKDIKVGVGDVEKITAATKAYTENLLKQAEATAINNRLAAIASERLNIKKTADPTILQSIVDGFLAAGNAQAFAARQAQTFGENIANQTNALKAEEDLLIERAKALKQNELATIASAGATDIDADAKERAKKMAEKYREVLADINAEVSKAKLFGESEDIAKIDALRKGMEELIEFGFKPASKEIQFLKKQWDALTTNPAPLPTTNIPGLPTPTSVQSQSAGPALPPILTSDRELTDAEKRAAKIKEIQEGIANGTLKFSDAFTQASEIISENGTLMQQAFLGMGDAISQAALQGEASFAKLGQAALGAAAKIIRAYIQQGVAAAVAKALSSVPFPLNLAAGAAAGGIAAALFTRAIGAIGVKGFARGTSYAPGGVALVGEQGPELINLPRGSQVFPTPQTNQMLNNIGGGGVNVTGEFRVQGTDLVLVLERAQQKVNRFR